MFKVLLIQAQQNLSDARMEFMIRDRLSSMRFFGFDLRGSSREENTVRLYRNRLTESGTLETLMQAFEQQLREAGYRKRPVETVVGNGQFRDAGGGTGMTGFGWKAEAQLPPAVTCG